MKGMIRLYSKINCGLAPDIGNNYSFTEVLCSCDQAYPFVYSCSFTFHTSYKIACGQRGEAVKIAQKQINRLFCTNMYRASYQFSMACIQYTSVNRSY